MRAIGILGGTFDPVHHGHLRLAVEMRERLSLARVHMIPAREPAHRAAPAADAATRLRMLQGALAGATDLLVDDREMRRAGASYTVDTLRSLRQELPGQPLCLIIGMDAFRDLPTWHRWRDILELAHLGVAERPGQRLPHDGPLAELLASRLANDPARVHALPPGNIFLADVPHLDISSSRIRGLVACHRSLQYLVPEPVAQAIANGGIYRHGK